MERLDCLVKEYAWGKKGAKSEVAKIFAAGHKNFKIGKQTPYAEVFFLYIITLYFNNFLYTTLYYIL